MRTIIAAGALLLLLAPARFDLALALAQGGAPSGPADQVADGVEILGPVYDAPLRTLELAPGLVRIVRVPAGFTDILIGSDQIAELTILSDQRIGVTGRSAGITNVLFSREDGAIVGELVVRVTPAAELGRYAVTVTSLAGGLSTRTHLCDPGRGRGCSFQGTRRETEPTPIINSGPVIVSDGAVTAAEP